MKDPVAQRPSEFLPALNVMAAQPISGLLYAQTLKLTPQLTLCPDASILPLVWQARGHSRPFKRPGELLMGPRDLEIQSVAAVQRLE